MADSLKHPLIPLLLFFLLLSSSRVVGACAAKGGGVFGEGASLTSGRPEEEVAIFRVDTR